MEAYTEISFYLPFFDLIDDTDEASSIEKLFRQFNINLDLTELYNKYKSYGEGADSVGKGMFLYFLRETIRKVLY